MLKNSAGQFGLCVGLLGGLAVSTVGAEAQGGLTLDEYLERVFARNETIQVQILESEVSRKRYQAERGIFEPQIYGNFEAIDQQRANTQEQRANLGFANVFNQRNRTYGSGVEMLTPLGTQLRLGYTMNDVNNNLNTMSFPEGEWVSTVGLSLTQPLLKGAWFPAVLADIRAAATESDIAFQNYRKGLIELLARAENTYWTLYLAQEQDAISRESVSRAETILGDQRERAKVGKASELDVLQAEAALAERHAVASEARQRLLESRNTAMSLYSESSITSGDNIEATDKPVLEPVSQEVAGYRARAFGSNPDILAQRERIELGTVRLKKANNERLPQLDLTAGYSANSIDDTPGGAHQGLLDANFPTWSVGVQFRMPLGGGRRAKRTAEGARLRVKSERLTLQNLEVQLDNALDTAVRNISTYHESTRNFRKVVDFNEKLLQTQLTRMDVGKIGIRDILETERDLFESKISHIQSLVRYQRATLGLEAVAGSLLELRGLEVTPEELRLKTSDIVRGGTLREEAYRDFVDGLGRTYRERRSSAAPAPSPDDSGE